MNSNDQFLDALLRHQIELLRYSSHVRDRIYRILDATEADMEDRILARLARRSALETPADVRRMQTLLAALRATRLRAWREVDAEWIRELSQVAAMEVSVVDGALKTVVPVVLNTTLPAPELLRAIVATRPFQGRVLREWASSVRRADLERIEAQVRIGMVQGEGARQIARRVVGTARLKGVDGVTEITRRNAAAITRTAVNAISNRAKQAFYMENSDVLSGELFVATLDARTTPQCRALDGKRYPVGEGPRPPMHFSCRSLRVALVDGEVIGNRPAKASTEAMLLREYGQRSNLSTPRSRADLPRGHKQAYDQFSRSRIRELTGRVPAKVDYQEWLGRQSVEFQDDVLGRTRAVLFREGGLRLDRFVDAQGRQLPLRDLARRQAEAFRAAGLDPDDFS